MQVYAIAFEQFVIDQFKLNKISSHTAQLDSWLVVDLHYYYQCLT